MYRNNPFRPSPNRFVWLRILGGILFAALLTSCAGKKEPQEKTVNLELVIEADDRVNADGQGRPTPIQLQVFELKSRSAFEEADYFSLQAKPRQILGNDLAESHELVLRPSDRKVLKRRLDGQTVALGVIAGYRDLGHSVWRATYVLPPKQAQAWFGSSSQNIRVRIKVGADAVLIAETD